MCFLFSIMAWLRYLARCNIQKSYRCLFVFYLEKIKTMKKKKKKTKEIISKQKLYRWRNKSLKL